MERKRIHAKIDEWIAAELAGGLSGEERLALSHHLEECAQCRAFSREARGVSELAGEALASDRPGPDFEDRMVEAFRKNTDSAEASGRQPPGPASPRPRLLSDLGKIAALLVVLVGGAVLLGPFAMFQSSESGPEGMAMDRLKSDSILKRSKAKRPEAGPAEAPEGEVMDLPGILEEHEWDEGLRRQAVEEAIAARRLAEMQADGGEKARELKVLLANGELARSALPGPAPSPQAAGKPAAVAGLAVPAAAPSQARGPGSGYRNGAGEREKRTSGRFYGAEEKYGDSPYSRPGVPGTESYDQAAHNPFKLVSEDARSTFSIDVDTASYANVRRFLESGRLPPPGAVRIEEMVNYFHYGYDGPTGPHPFAVHLEVARCPWDLEHRLVRVGIKGREIDRDRRPPTNLVFLIDVSGSMRPNNKLPLLKQGMKMLVGQLTEDDHVGIVVYAGAARVVLPSTPCDRKDRVLAAIDGLQAGGSTNGGAGIHMAYEEAARFYVKGGVNRVMLATDGDFNVGLTNRSDLVNVIQEKARGGIFLTVLGFGMGNYKDSTLEAIADKGNGNYAYIDDVKEARKVLVEEMTGTLVAIAKDVKLQIEFNPLAVHAWRLVGYENRVLAHRDFNDDRKDAGEIGAGHTVTALYEIVPAGVQLREPGVDPLKYQKPAPELSDEAYSGELLTLKLRYKNPDSDTSVPVEFTVMDSILLYSQASPDFRFASLVAAFGMILRDSPYRGKMSYAGIAETAADCLGADPEGRRAEFVSLVRKAGALAGEGR